jgi:hypothetical protein
MRNQRKPRCEKREGLEWQNQDQTENGCALQA